MTVREEIGELVKRHEIELDRFCQVLAEEAEEVEFRLTHYFREDFIHRTDGISRHIRSDLRQITPIAFEGNNTDDWLDFCEYAVGFFEKGSRAYLCIPDDGVTVIYNGALPEISAVIGYGTPIGFEDGDFVIVSESFDRLLWYEGENDMIGVVYNSKNKIRN